MAPDFAEQPPTESDQDHPEGLSHGVGILKETEHLVWRGVGRDIVIRGPQAQKKVTHAPPGQVRDMPPLAEGPDDPFRAEFRRGSRSLTARL